MRLQQLLRALPVLDPRQRRDAGRGRARRREGPEPRGERGAPGAVRARVQEGEVGRPVRRRHDLAEAVAVRAAVRRRVHEARGGFGTIAPAEPSYNALRLADGHEATITVGPARLRVPRRARRAAPHGDDSSSRRVGLEDDRRVGDDDRAIHEQCGGVRVDDALHFKARGDATRSVNISRGDRHARPR